MTTPDRSQLKLEMLYALDNSTRTRCDSREQVLDLIKAGSADLLVTLTGSHSPTQHLAIRFNDRDLGERARADCLDLYRLR